ncbi:UNKNOWN [Stylonychia lemnae]|uniref:Uncharacterized protein n=1 Tax=Stylonychia lemnae TaxID=5949 RepID=A0A077ZRV5_STYLE|nr:UNKNOWN [Stylonychia lemnae]|eukprot:CDW72643.1 UNKNOWN [Stylonychia lemnae]
MLRVLWLSIIIAFPQLFYLLNQINGQIIALPQCFGSKQLPIELTKDAGIFSKFTVLQYLDEYDYFAIGGVYGSDMIIGFYNNKVGFNRFMWLNSYNYAPDQMFQPLLQQIQAIQFQSKLHIITLIRSEQIQKNNNEIEIPFLVLLMGFNKNGDGRFNLFATGLANSDELLTNIYDSTSIVSYDVIIAQMAVRFNYAVGCLESQDSTQAFMGALIHQIGNSQSSLIFRNVSSSYAQRNFECIGIKIAAKDDITLVYQSYYEKADIFMAWLKQDPLSITGEYFVYENQLRLNKPDSLTVYQFKYVQVIDDYFHLDDYNPQYQVKQPYQAISLYYSEQFFGTKTILEALFTVKPDIVEMKNLLPQVVLWSNQQVQGNDSILVSELPVQQYRIPKKLPLIIDCYLGMQCEMYFSNFTLKNSCFDEIGQNKKYFIEIGINGTQHQQLQSMSDQSSLSTTLSYKYYQLNKIGLHYFQFTYKIQDTLNLENKWTLLEDVFTLNITNGCQNQYKLLEDPKVISIKQKIQTDVKYYSIPKLRLGPYQECFKQSLTISLIRNRQQSLTIINLDKKQDFQIGFLTNNVSNIGQYEFQYHIEVTADIEQFTSQRSIPQFLQLEIISDSDQFTISNSAPYFTEQVPDYEVTVGQLMIADLPRINDQEGDDYVVLIKGKKASIFITATKQKLIINPIQPVVGKHKITIILKDKNKQSLQKKYYFQVLVKPEVSTYFESLLKDSIFLEDYKKSQSYKIIGHIEGKINKITNTGQVVVLFDQNLDDNQSKFQNKVQQSIQIVLSQEDKEIDLKFEVKEITQRKIILQLNFTEPENISKYSVNLNNQLIYQDWDRLIIKFKLNFLFHDKTEKLMMKEGYQIQGYIPPQINQGLKELLNSFGSATSVSLSTIMGSNLIINIIMQEHPTQYIMQVIEYLNVVGNDQQFPINYSSTFNVSQLTCQRGIILQFYTRCIQFLIL